jgi:hypothetical protein
MNPKLTQLLEEFDQKIVTYDLNGGFMVYVEDEDCTDFNTDLVKDFVAHAYNAGRDEAKEAQNKMWTDMLKELPIALQQLQGEFALKKILAQNDAPKSTIEKIEQLATEFPLRGSEEFDDGRRSMKREVLDILK